MTRTPRLQRLSGDMSLLGNAGTAIGESRIRLLEEIERRGSITAAARVIPMSYKAAWNALETMNHLTSSPVVVRVTGGRRGGGTRLTDYGKRLVRMYRSLEQEYQASFRRLARQLLGTDESDVSAISSAYVQPKMKTSTRNRFAGVVAGVSKGMVQQEVRIVIDGGEQLVATITAQSAHDLGLAVGSKVVALVKASAVVLTIERALRFSARNQLWGEVVDIRRGAVNNEVTVQLPSGNRVTSVVTLESCDELGLHAGSEVGALFKATSILIAVEDP